MKLSLPISPKYVLPVLGLVLALDVVVMAGAGLALYRAGDRVRTLEIDQHNCVMYSPVSLGTVYGVFRCEPKEPANGR